MPHLVSDARNTGRISRVEIRQHPRSHDEYPEQDRDLHHHDEESVTRINDELVVEARSTQSFRFTPSVVPGTFSVSWRSSGRGYGGANDTISAFRLTDPKDVQLEASPVGAVSDGRFLVRVTEKGAYTLWFDNKGLLRNTSRRIFIEGEYRPD